MVQSLGLRAKGELTEDVMSYISRRINPNYLMAQLRNLGVPNIRCAECGTTTYDLVQPYETFPTDDLTLRLENGRFSGSASGAEQSDKLIVKAIALRKIQEILRDRGIPSRMNFSDLDDFNYARLGLYGLVDGSPKRGRMSSIDGRILGQVAVREMGKRNQAELEYLHRN